MRQRQPMIFTPTSFREMDAASDAFKAASTVVVNLLAADEAEKRRIIDFASGLVVGLGGELEMLAPGFMVLRPARWRAAAAAERANPRRFVGPYQP